MLDVLQLREELVGVTVRSAAVLAPVVAQDGPDLYTLLLEEWQHMVVQDLDGRDRYLARVESGPDVAAEAVEHGLDVDLADALEPAKKVFTASWLLS